MFKNVKDLKIMHNLITLWDHWLLIDLQSFMGHIIMNICYKIKSVISKVYEYEKGITV